MEIPAMALDGVVPTLSPLLILCLVLMMAGAFMLALALLVRNYRLVTKERLNPFSAADLQRAGDPTVSTRAADSLPFHRSLYGRLATGLFGLGAAGTAIMLSVALFAG